MSRRPDGALSSLAKDSASSGPAGRSSDLECDDDACCMTASGVRLSPNASELLTIRFEELAAKIKQGACIPERTSLIAELIEVLQLPECPPALRMRGLEVVGKLARREQCEPACQSGLQKMMTRIKARSSG